MLSLDLTGRRALVCGGSRGIGLAAGRALAGLGARVTLAARDRARVEASAASLPGEGHAGISLDLTDPEAARAEAERLAAGDPVHVIVCNSGGPPEGAPMSLSVDDYQRAFTEHLATSHALAQALVPGMTDAGYGRIVTVTSTSVKAPIPRLAASNVVRAAVANWVKSLSIELGPAGITVNNVLPGFTETDRLGDLIAEWAGAEGITPEAFAERARAGIPARRFGAPEEVGAAIAFLASPAAAYISGVNLPVDGGRLPTL